MEDRPETDPRRLEELRRRARERRCTAGPHGSRRPANGLREPRREFITNHLSLTERRIIMLEYVERMTRQEIGATLDLPSSRVAELRRSIDVRMRAYCGGTSTCRQGSCGLMPTAVRPESRKRHPPGRNAASGARCGSRPS